MVRYGINSCKFVLAMMAMYRNRVVLWIRCHKHNIYLLWMEFLGITARYSYICGMNEYEWMMVIFLHRVNGFEGRIKYDDARNIEIIWATVEHNIQFKSYKEFIWAISLLLSFYIIVFEIRLKRTTLYLSLMYFRPISHPCI